MFRFAIYKIAARNAHLSLVPKQFAVAISSSSKLPICKKSFEHNLIPVCNDQSLFKEFVPAVTGNLRAVAFSTDRDDKSSKSAYQTTEGSASYLGSDSKKHPNHPECESSITISADEKPDYKIEISKNTAKPTTAGGDPCVGSGTVGGAASGSGGGAGGGGTGSSSSGGGDGGTVATAPQFQMPSKQQVEKYFFRVVAFVYDLTYLTLNWTTKALDEHVLKNDKVQLYWKKFHDKMQQAKRDE